MEDPFEIILWHIWWDRQSYWLDQLGFIVAGVAQPYCGASGPGGIYVLGSGIKNPWSERIEASGQVHHSTYDLHPKTLKKDIGAKKRYFESQYFNDCVESHQNSPLLIEIWQGKNKCRFGLLKSICLLDTLALHWKTLERVFLSWSNLKMWHRHRTEYMYSYRTFHGKQVKHIHTHTHTDMRAFYVVTLVWP